jgi:energy-coupling factor transporter ATP-binding protein EcfA2
VESVRAGGAGEPLLAFDSVRFSYPGAFGPALDGVTLAINAGEGVALLGHNGAGKTTLMRLAMAFIHPSSGNVAVSGTSTMGCGPEDIAPVAGYLFQQPESQLFERTVRAELAFGPRQLGWEPGRIADRVELLLELLELSGAADEHPYDLPLPRRRLVALGTALAAQPRLLLLDEPTAGLDRAARDLVARVVRGHVATGGAAVAVCHDARFALEALGRSVVLQSGGVAADGSTAAVLAEAEGSPPVPAHAELAMRLGLQPATLRLQDVASALAVHCSSGG